MPQHNAARTPPRTLMASVRWTFAALSLAFAARHLSSVSGQIQVTQITLRAVPTMADADLSNGRLAPEAPVPSRETWATTSPGRTPALVNRFPLSN